MGIREEMVDRVGRRKEMMVDGGDGVGRWVIRVVNGWIKRW